MLAREIVECLMGESKDAVKLSWDNFPDAFRRPRVVNGDFLEYLSGSFDGAVARLVADIKGSRFVRGRDDSLWRPKDEDDLVGVRDFVGSSRYRELGYAEPNDSGRRACFETAQRVISDLLNRKFSPDRIFSMSYRDRPLFRVDFEDVCKSLRDFRYGGFIYDKGHWRGVHTDDWDLEEKNKCCARTCALGLIESLEAKDAKQYAYVSMTRKNHARLVEVAEQGEDEGAKRLIAEALRKVDTKDIVWMWLSSDSVALILSRLQQSRHVERNLIMSEFSRDFEKGMKRWRKACRNDFFDMMLNQDFSFPVEALPHSGE